MKNRSSRRVLSVVAILLAALLAAGCTTTIAGYASHGEGGVKKDAAPSDLEIINGDGSEIDQLVANSIDDIETYWDEHFEDVFGQEFEPLQGGVHAYEVNGTMDIPCFSGSDRQSAANNAFYCPSEDAIAFDREFLQSLVDEFGEFIVPMVMAHEFGHAIQQRVGYPTNQTISSEGQADCYAGVFSSATVDGTEHFQSTSADLDTVLGGYLLLRDEPGSSSSAEGAHGSAFDRVGAFQEGFNEGPEHCYTSFGEDREYTEIPYLTQNDQANAGNLPFDDVLKTVPEEMNKFGSVVAGNDWTEIPTEQFDSSGTKCDGDPAPEDVFYCSFATTVYAYDDLVQQSYDKFGDFAAMTAIALGYGDAIQQLTDSDQGGATAFKGRLCMVGAYAGAAFEATVSGQPSEFGDLQLSAGDLDESVMLLLALGEDDAYLKTHGVDAFDRIDVFRQAVLGARDDAIGTAQDCLQISD